MIELLSLLGGALVRLLPTLADFFKQKQDLKYEVQRLDKEIELEKQRGLNAQQEIAASSASKVDEGWAAAFSKAVESQGVVTGDRWLDRINVSVRPILTYWWCMVLYTLAKLCIILSAFLAPTRPELGAFAALLVTDFDKSVIGSILGFWFVDRAMRTSGMK